MFNNNGFFNGFKKIISQGNKKADGRGQNIEDNPHEYCPRCEANITLQKGYRNDLDYWTCTGCGEMLINPNLHDESCVVWICDGCGAILNRQDDFSEKYERFKCTLCGYENNINENEIYLSEDEFISDINSTCKGLSDEDILELSSYYEIENIDGRKDVILVEDIDTKKKYVKKILTTYDLNVYKYLLENPVSGMPGLFGLYEGRNNLIVIEEYIAGKTLEDILENENISIYETVGTVKDLCIILRRLHNLDVPIIHRDIKPSNVMIGEDGKVYLLDVNAARLFKEEKGDTHIMGTFYYAAPEQFGYGFSESSCKSDIYALGILMNVMITGKVPKEEKADGAIWNIIEKCISFDPQERYSATELFEALGSIEV